MDRMSIFRRGRERARNDSRGIPPSEIRRPSSFGPGRRPGRRRRISPRAVFFLGLLALAVLVSLAAHVRFAGMSWKQIFSSPASVEEPPDPASGPSDR